MQETARFTIDGLRHLKDIFVNDEYFVDAYEDDLDAFLSWLEKPYREDLSEEGEEK